MAMANAHETQVHLPEEWEEAANTVAYDSLHSPPPICVVCGHPNSGKSTFSRHLLNLLINRYTRVAYLDTDVGQSEFTPPGCLSLTVVDKVTPDLAIPCLRTPERCFFFGDITPRKDPKMYLEYICALYDYYYKQYQPKPPLKIGVPLVVNTPGWVEGIGFNNILVGMLRHIAPSIVVKVCVSAHESKNLPSGKFWLEEGEAQEVTLVEIMSQESLKSVHAENDARLLRDLRLLAYFRKCFPSNKSITTIEELDYRLAVHPPYKVLTSSVTIKQLHFEVPCTETIYRSNSIIIGLAVSSLNFEHLPCCVGLGIVRGIDISQKILYLITPVPEDMLKNVDLLLHGLIEIPTCLLQVTSKTLPANEQI